MGMQRNRSARQAEAKERDAARAAPVSYTHLRAHET